MTLSIDDVVACHVRWWHGYANSPELEMVVKDGSLPKHSDFIYEAIPTGTNPDKYEFPSSHFLLSTNLWPVVKYVSIADHKGSPSHHGSLGGKFKLTDGREVHSRTGWSARSGVVNKHYYDRLPGGAEIMSIPVKEESQGIYWAGYDFSIEFAKEVVAEFLPHLYLVRELKFSDWEPYWIPSTKPDRVEKPND